MKSIINLFISTLPILVLFAFFSPARPDAANIARLCLETEQPVICSDCLNADPGSQTTDGRGLAIIAIECAERDTKAIAKKLENLVGSMPESKLKTILNDCMVSTESAAGDFPGVERELWLGNYDVGKKFLALTSWDVNDCLNNLRNNSSIQVPPEILLGTVAAAQDIEIATVILSKI